MKGIYDFSQAENDSKKVTQEIQYLCLDSVVVESASAAWKSVHRCCDLSVLSLQGATERAHLVCKLGKILLIKQEQVQTMSLICFSSHHI